MEALRQALTPRGNTGRRIGAGVISLCVLALILLPLVSGGEQLGIGAQVVPRPGAWIVASVDTGSVAARAGLRVNDVIVSVDGIAPPHRDRFDPVLSLGGSHTWTVLRQGALRVLRPNPEQVSWSLREGPILLMLIAVAFWLGATFVRIFQPRDGLVGQLYRLSLSMALALALNTAADNNVAWAKVCEVCAFAVLPAQFLNFCFWISAGGRPVGRMALVIRVLFVAGSTLGCGYLVAGLAGSPFYDALRGALLALLAPAFLGGLIALFHAARLARSPLARQRAVIILLGIAIAVLPLTVLAIIPVIAGRPAVIPPQMAALSMVALPVSLAYAILRYQLLDIQLMLHRTVVYGAMTVLLAGCYAILLYWLSAADPSLSQSRLSLIGLGFFALVSMTFMPLRQRVIFLVDHFMFHDRYDYAGTLQRLGASLASVHHIDQVLTEVVRSLGSAMNLTGAAVIAHGVGGDLAIRVASGAYLDPASAHRLLSRMPTMPPEGVVNDSGGYWQPMRAYDIQYGLLYLGPKQSGVRFSAGDLRLAATLASEAALAMANGLLVEQLEEKVTELRLMYDRLLTAQAEERKCLARDVHDNVLQHVLHVLRLSDTLATAPRPKHGDMLRLTTRLQTLAEESREAEHALRGLCQGLYPAELTDVGLVATLRDRARLISRDQPVVVRVVATECCEALRLPADLEYTLFRIAQEALANIARHASATTATISFSTEGGRAILAIMDDGRGFRVPLSLTALPRAGHFGLVGIREQAEHWGGSCLISSARGEGTTIRIQVPLPRETRVALLAEQLA